MYAVFQSGGKQHRVTEGQVIRLEKLTQPKGDMVTFEKILLVAQGKDIKFGTPYLDKSKIVAKVVDHARGDKVNIVKFRRRKHSRKKQGHRQWFTAVKIDQIIV